MNALLLYFSFIQHSLKRTPVNCFLIGKPRFKFTYLVCINSFFHIGNTVSQKNWKKCGKFRRKRKIKRILFLQTLEIRKKLLQIYCYQNFCSNALTVHFSKVTAVTVILSKSYWKVTAVTFYCSNPKVWLHVIKSTTTLSMQSKIT